MLEQVSKCGNNSAFQEIGRNEHRSLGKKAAEDFGSVTLPPRFRFILGALLLFKSRFKAKWALLEIAFRPNRKMQSHCGLAILQEMPSIEIEKLKHFLTPRTVQWK